MNLKLFCVSILIPTTRQAMSGLVFADTEEEAIEIYREYVGFPDTFEFVVDPVGIEKGLVTTVTNDRAVLNKYFWSKEEKETPS